MTAHNDYQITWEDLFEQATEDASKYLWAVSEWTDPQEGFEQDYLLMTALSSRMRSRLAIEQMTGSMPLEYNRYKEKIIRIRLKAEEILNHQMSAYQKQMENILNGKGVLHLNAIEKILLDTLRLSREKDSRCNAEWIGDSLRETAHDFLVLFCDAALVNDELNTESRHLINAEDFQKKFAEIEMLFWQYFDCFYEIKELFAPVRAGEYFLNRWWLTRIPKKMPQEFFMFVSLIVALSYHTIRQRQFRYMCDKSEQKTDSDDLTGWLPAFGHRQGSQVVLFEDLDEYPSELKKTIQHIRTSQRLYSRVLTQETDGKWIDRDFEIKDFPVTVEDTVHERFVLLVDTQGKMMLKKSAETILNKLNNPSEGIPDKKVSSNTFVIFIEIFPKKQESADENYHNIS